MQPAAPMLAVSSIATCRIGPPGWGEGFTICGAREAEAPAGACPAQLGILCRPRILAHAEASGPKDTPEKPKPGGHCLILELPVGGGSAKAKPPRVFPFWKLGTSLFMTFSRGGERGTSWVYGSDTICVMTSAPIRPLSSVNSWEGPGWAWNAGCQGG